MDLFTIFLWAVILVFSVIASVQDICHGKVYDFLIFGGIFCGILVNLVFNHEKLLFVTLSALVYGIFYFLIKVISGGKLGNADLYFGFFQGIFLPVKFLPLCVLLETIFAFTTVSIFKNRNCSEKIPFIPFMSGALIICFFITLMV